MAGRPSGLLLDPDAPGPFVQEPAELDPRGRIALPPRIASGITWLQIAENAYALAVLEADRSVRLLDFATHGQPVLERRRELIEEIKNNAPAREALVVLEDRYHRVAVSPERRITLGKAIITHLQSTGSETLLYIETFSDEIHLVPEAVRLQRLARHHDLLSGLP